ncbi:MAG: hypothetical protein WCD39_02530, partial [Methyloceanibacter sp.]
IRTHGTVTRTTADLQRAVKFVSCSLSLVPYLLSAAKVRLWHKADVLNSLTNVRFWEQSGH